MEKFELLDKLAELAENNGWAFLSGDDYYQNYEASSHEYTAGQYILGCDFVASEQYSQAGALNAINYIGSIRFGRKVDPIADGEDASDRANLDETFKQKHDRRLKEMKQTLSNELSNFACQYQLSITNAVGLLEINKFDANIDFVGLQITFNQEDFDFETPSYYDLIMEAATGGTTYPSEGTYNYLENTIVPIHAIADSGYRFVRWLIAGLEDLSALTYVKMANVKNVVAEFIAQFNLTTSVDGNGTITPDNDVYDDGAIVEITATPNDENTLLDRIEVNSVDVGNTSTYQLLMDGIKSVVAYFKTIYNIPFGEDAVEIWNGNIIEVDGVHYLEGQKGVGNLLITDYDFDTSWENGIPYKSKSTVSAPVGNVTLIANDVNNFFYDSLGSPNKIPAVLFFQNVDYEGRLFSKHNSQLVVDYPIETEVSGIYEDYELETQQASLQQIALYSTEKTGVDLDTCNTYYNVPVKQTTNILEVGVGKTYTTISSAIAASSTGDRIYIYTGNYKEDVNVGFGRELELYGLGKVDITSNDLATYGMLIGSDNTSFIGLRYTNNGNSIGISSSKINTLFNKCYIESVGDRTIYFRGLGGYEIENCVILGGISYTDGLNGNFYINSSYLSHNSVIGPIFQYGVQPSTKPTIGTEFKVEHNTINKIVATSSASGNVITTYGDIITILDNVINSTGQSYISAYLYSTTTDRFVLNTVNSETGYVNFYSDHFLNNKIIFASIVNVTENRMLYQPIAGRYDLHFKNNIILAKRLALELRQINTTEYSVYFRNNYIESYYAPSFGGGFTIYCVAPLSTEDTEWKLYFTNNTVKNSKVFTPNENAAHTCLYLWQMKYFHVENNYLSGSETAEIVIKSNQVGTTNAVMANILYNMFVGTVSVIFKGVSNIKMYNNTCIRNVVNATDLSVIKSMDNDDGNLSISNNLDFRNNILINKLYQYGIRCESLTGGDDFTFNNNLYYSEVGSIINMFKQVDKTFTQWQDLGFDVDGVEQNPNVLNDLYPTPKLEIGENLGSTYEDGLDIATNWGNESTLPVVLSKEQGVTWQLGAYVK